MNYGCDTVKKVPIDVIFTKLQYVHQLGPNLKNLTIYYVLVCKCMQVHGIYAHAYLCIIMHFKLYVSRSVCTMFLYPRVITTKLRHGLLFIHRYLDSI